MLSISGMSSGARVGDLRVVVVDAGVEQVGQQVVLRIASAPLELIGEVVLELVDAPLGLEALLERRGRCRCRRSSRRTSA